MEIIRKGSGSYGECWVERDGAYYFVVLLNGKSRRGPYSSVADALEELSHYIN